VINFTVINFTVINFAVINFYAANFSVNAVNLPVNTEPPNVGGSCLSKLCMTRTPTYD